jgi:hypothetical protein
MEPITAQEVIGKLNEVQNDLRTQLLALLALVADAPQERAEETTTAAPTRPHERARRATGYWGEEIDDALSRSGLAPAQQRMLSDWARKRVEA